MTLFSSLLLGLIQGAAEFLPISSSGHLAIAEHLLGQATEIPDFLTSYCIWAPWRRYSSPIGRTSATCCWN